VQKCAQPRRVRPDVDKRLRTPVRLMLLILTFNSESVLLALHSVRLFLYLVSEYTSYQEVLMAMNA
jgi:hypothetical protein